MPSLLEALNSQIGRKLLTGVTGILLLLFVIIHLFGNLAIFGEAEAMNRYSLFLHDFGPLLWVARIGLLVVFLVHAWIGVSIWWNKRKARPQKYEVYSSKGGPSKQSISSRSMAFTGVILFIFVIFHLNTFAFGETQTVIIDGREASDIKQLVIDTFQNPVYAFGYTFVMLLLGTHLGHGIWSAFTSLGMSSTKVSATVYTAGVVFALLLAIGFLFIPLYIFFTGGAGSLISY
ncbi:MAG: succinate dehydrogenase cytochrome b subunit [Balneolaceae bacterium]